MPYFWDDRERILTEVWGDDPVIPWYRRNIKGELLRERRQAIIPEETAELWKKRRVSGRAHRGVLKDRPLRGREAEKEARKEEEEEEDIAGERPIVDKEKYDVSIESILKVNHIRTRIRTVYGPVYNP